MFTIQDYIDSLNRDKESLVANLTTKGISASDSETFTTLVPKVLDIISVNNQSKSTTITSNTTTTITPDEGYTGLSSVEVTTNVALDLSDYFNSSMTAPNSQQTTGLSKLIKKIPSNTVLPTDLSYGFTGAIDINVDNLDFSSVQNFSNCFSNNINMVTSPNINTSSATKMSNMFSNCFNLVTVRNYDMSHVTDISGMFNGDTKLENLPLMNLSSISGKWSLNSVFSTNVLTNDSLNNLLGSLATITSAYTGTKTLKFVFGNSDISQYYPASTIEQMSNYQDFIDAGWTIGY